jgi:hypothetical protein
MLNKPELSIIRKTPKKNYLKQMQQYGLTKYADTNI